jgi:hypothetical protein
MSNGTTTGNSTGEIVDTTFSSSSPPIHETEVQCQLRVLPKAAFRQSCSDTEDTDMTCNKIVLERKHTSMGVVSSTTCSCLCSLAVCRKTRLSSLAGPASLSHTSCGTVCPEEELCSCSNAGLSPQPRSVNSPSICSLDQQQERTMDSCFESLQARHLHGVLAGKQLPDCYTSSYICSCRPCLVRPLTR